MSEMGFHIFIGVWVVIILVAGFCCLAMANKQEQISDEEWEEFCRMQMGVEDDESESV